MHDRRTPTNLLADRLWAGWGPAIESRLITDDAIELIARRTGRELGQVGDVMLHSGDRGRYLLLERLSVTGHAAVYAGVDRSLAREVAVKIHRDGRRHAGYRAIFESQAMARLAHPNVVGVYDVGEQDTGEHGAWLYSVMELCDTDLDDWRVGRGWVEIVARIVEAAQGLRRLHELGYAHGDIKPRNILIHDDTAKLADFGHATKLDALVPATGGTVGYIAPEVLERGPSFAADVFALAVTTWECMFGGLPYPVPEGEHVSLRIGLLATTQRALDRDLARPKRTPRGLPRAIRWSLEAALDPDPRLRPTLDEFIRVLRRARDRDARRRRRRRRLPIVAGAAAVLLGLGFAIGAQRGRSSTGGDAPMLTTAALSAFSPLAEAEAAAHLGDVDKAIGALYRFNAGADHLSVAELEDAADTAKRIAVLFEQRGAHPHAALAWGFAAHLYRKAELIDDADSALQAVDRNVKAVPD